MIRGNHSFFITGGTLGQDTPSYVERQADTDLYEGLRQGEFCYVLTARQMGKSSLMVRTANRLREAGFSVVTLDLTMVGQNLTLEQWYYGLLNLTGRQLGLRQELREFWVAHPELGPLQRFMQALEQVALDSLDRETEHGARGLVVFVDEIDSVLSLPFSTDELFAAIRQCYNRRAEEPALQRLTFCLLGVTSPSQLIRDVRTTPFNVGRRIELHDFREPEARPLAVGLQLGAAGDPLRPLPEAQRLLQRVLYWTNGHPYLTQRLCQAVAEDPKARDSRAVDRICRGLFLTPGARNRDDNLLFVQERLVNRTDDVAAYLDLYRRIRIGQRVPDDETDPRVPELRLSGIVREEQGYVRVRNRIYQQVFDTGWIEARMPDAELRRQKAAYQQGLRRSAAIASAVVAVTGGLAAWGGWASHRAQESEAKARKLAADRGAALTRASQLLYVSNIKTAWQGVQAGNYEQASELLKTHIPKRRADPDLRSWEWYYLWSVCHPERRLLRGSTTPLVTLAFDPTGSVLFSADASHRLLRHDLTAGTSSVLFAPGSTGLTRNNSAICPVGPLAFGLAHQGAPNQALNTSPGSGPLGKPWEIRAADFKSGRERVIASSPVELSQLCASQDARLLAAIRRGEEPRRVQVWDGQGHPLGILQDRDRSVSVVAVAPDGSRIATGNRSGEVVLWNARTLRPEARLPCADSRIKDLAFSANGGTLLVGSKHLRALEVRTRSLGPALPWRGKYLFALAVSPDGKLAATGTGDPSRMDTPGEIEIWDLVHGRSMRRLRGHTGPATALALAADGRTLATGGWDRTVRLWDLRATPKPEIYGHSGQTQAAIGFWPKPTSLAIRFPGRIALFDAATLTPGTSLRAPTTGAMDVSLTGTVLAVAAGDEVLVWNNPQQPVSHHLPHAATVTSLSLAPDGNRLITTDGRGAIRVWDLATETAELRPEVGFAAAFDPAGRGLAIADRTGRLVLDAGPGREPQRAQLSGVAPRSMRCSPDGRYLAVLTHHSVSVFDRATGAEVVLKGHQQNVETATFTRDSRTIVTSGGDQAIRLWNLATGEELGVLKGGTKGNSVAFSPDGTKLVAGGYEGTLRIWTATTATSPGPAR